MLTSQKACALLEGLEAGSGWSALVRVRSSVGLRGLTIQRQAQDTTSEAPAGQRTIPRFERHTAPTEANVEVAVEGIEKPMRAVAI
jgi:hypothetical protein